MSKLLFEALSGTEKEARICADALSAAIQSRDDETVRLLLEHGLTLSVETLRQACAAGLEKTVRMPLVNGIDDNSDESTKCPPPTRCSLPLLSSRRAAKSSKLINATLTRIWLANTFQIGLNFFIWSSKALLTVR